MPTLLLPPRVSSDSVALWRAAIAAGWRTERLSGWRVAEGTRFEEPALYGEPLFVEAVCEQLGVAVVSPPDDWLASIPEEFRRREVEYSTAGALRKGVCGRRFVKPAEFKCFAAGVYDLPGAFPAAEVVPDETPVLAAECVEWSVEYRCFVLERAVLTFSIYLRDGELAGGEDGSWPAPVDEAAEALAFAQRLLAEPAIAVPPAVVLDVGRIAGRGWAAVELNAAWGSGIYGCDPAAVLEVIRHATNASA
jgi:hypothetical protein